MRNKAALEKVATVSSLVDEGTGCYTSYQSLVPSLKPTLVLCLVTIFYCSFVLLL